MKFWHKILLGILIGLIISTGGYFWYSTYQSAQIVRANNTTKLSQLPILSVDELKKFNGTNDSLPIYMAVNGKVYDVTRGRDFYKTDGVYHYLAGKDSTEDLKPVGTEIITNKYPIIAILQS